MSYSICRIAKVKASGVTGIQIHDRREKESVSHTNKDIDWSKTHENVDLLEQRERFRTVISGRIAELNLPRAILNMGGVFGSHSVSVLHNIDAMKETIANMDFGVKLMTSVQVTIIWLVFKFSTMAIMLVIIGRMIQIYIMMAIAAIPMATMANADLSSVGKNFLKSFAAVCVQGTLIYIVLNMYGTLVGSIASTTEFTNITAALFEALLYSLVLVMAIFATGRISKSICNAM